MNRTNQILRDLTEAADISVRTNPQLLRSVNKVTAKDDAKRRGKGDRLRRKSDLAELRASPMRRDLAADPVAYPARPRTCAFPVTTGREPRSGGALGQPQIQPWRWTPYRGSIWAFPVRERTTSLTSTSGFSRRNSAMDSLACWPSGTLQRRSSGPLRLHCQRGRRAPGGLAAEVVEVQYQPDFLRRNLEARRAFADHADRCQGEPRPASDHISQPAGLLLRARRGRRRREWQQTPALLFSTELSPDGPLTVHTLHSAGKGGWLDLPRKLAEPPRRSG